MTHTRPECERLLNSWADKVGNTDTPISKICDDLHIDPETIRVWASQEDEWKRLYNAAIMKRAWRYADEARAVLKDAQTFFTDEKSRIKECNSPVNKAKHYADFLLRLASVLAPQVFSDFRHEIKQMQKEIAELRKLIEKRNGCKKND